MNKPSVGVIGLGSMGGGVAKSLLRADFPVRVCDVRPEVVQSFVDSGAVAARRPAELGAACDVVIVLVVNAEQTEPCCSARTAPRRRCAGQRARHERHRGARLRRCVSVPRLAERGIADDRRAGFGRRGQGRHRRDDRDGVRDAPEAFAKCEPVS